MMLPELKTLARLFHNPQFNNSFSHIRVLIELGKEEPTSVMTAFQHALHHRNQNTQLTALTEIITLYNTHPLHFSPLLEQLLDHDNPHVQWGAALTLSGAEHYARSIPFYPSSENKIAIHDDESDLLFEAITIALESEDEILEWNATLSLVEWLEDYPDKAIPLLLRCLDIQNLHVQWLASLTLLKHSSYDFQEEKHMLPQSSSRVLIDLAPQSENIALVLLQRGLKSSDEQLRLAALYELVTLGMEGNKKALTLIKNGVEYFHHPIFTS